MSSEQLQPPAPLPAQYVDSTGRAHVDLRAVLVLALPLIANSGVQLLLNLTDLWFVGHISVTALAAVGAVHWLAIVIVMILSGVGMAVQTVAAQAYGSRRYRRSAQAAWTALWGCLLAVPLFLLAGRAAHLLLAPFDLPPAIEAQAAAFWWPRVAGAVFGAGAWAMMGFFNGVGRTRMTLYITLVMALSNALFNALFVFQLQWGVAGSAVATTLSQSAGLLVALAVFLAGEFNTRFGSRLTWKLHAGRLWQQVRLGFPMGLLAAADLLGIAIFLLMQVRIGPVEGAASQLAMSLTALAYMPGFGISLAGTTLVGQSIGAGDVRWARRLGNRILLLAAVYMGGMGLLTAALGPYIVPWFAGAADATRPLVIALSLKLLWISAIYQLFDGLNMGSGGALRGAGDAVVPAVLVMALSWLVFLPLAHALSFAPGQGWYGQLPLLGLGATGGWWALVIYISLLGLALTLRWRSRAWEVRHA